VNSIYLLSSEDLVICKKAKEMTDAALARYKLQLAT
jgi:hypothetical protein